jgi:hypothetical protein
MSSAKDERPAKVMVLNQWTISGNDNLVGVTPVVAPTTLMMPWIWLGMIIDSSMQIPG